MYPRLLNKSEKSFFLFGPRGTGKSTWLLNVYPTATRIDLLRSSVFLKYQRDHEVLRNEVLALPKGSWILIDEIQKLPTLLDEVHALLFDTQNSVQFALTGSSARKLKKTHANLLAGRAISKSFYPLLSVEMGEDFSLESALQFGMLPALQGLKTLEEKAEYLDSYVETYLKEEIQQEALVRSLTSFHRFLEVSAIANSTLLNLSNIAREVGVARTTVQGYFDVLLDTLLGSLLPAYVPKAKIKEVAHPKFYWFDVGILRAIRGETRSAIEKSELGHLFETFIINELKALNSYTNKGGKFSYWRTEGGNEVDCLWIQGKRKIAFEVKISQSWKSEFNSGLRTLLEEGKITQGYGIYTGQNPLKMGDIWIFPYQEALKRFQRDEL